MDLQIRNYQLVLFHHLIQLLLLLDRKIRNFSELKDAALEIYEKYGCSVLLKGGYPDNAEYFSDTLCVKGKTAILRYPCVDLDSATEAHGSGGTLSAALTAGFAMGMDWENSLQDAAAFVVGSLRETAQIGPDIFSLIIWS